MYVFTQSLFGQCVALEFGNAQNKSNEMLFVSVFFLFKIFDKRKSLLHVFFFSPFELKNYLVSITESFASTLIDVHVGIFMSMVL